MATFDEHRVVWVVVVRGAVALFGDKVFRYVASFVVGLIVFTVAEAGAAQTALFAQPFGQWYMAGITGGESAQGLTGDATPAMTAPAPFNPNTALAPQISIVAQPQPVAIDTATALRPGELEYARTWLGVPYQWGGCSRRGIDCSCFVQNVLTTVGYSGVPRVTTDQVRWARPVARADVQPGDLVFFNNTCTDCGANPTHVGLYIGGGNMIDAGDPVQINPVFTGFYGSHFASAGAPR